MLPGIDGSVSKNLNPKNMAYICDETEYPIEKNQQQEEGIMNNKFPQEQNTTAFYLLAIVWREPPWGRALLIG